MMQHIYYMVFEHWSASGKLGNSWCEMHFDSPVTSIRDLREAADFEKGKQKKNEAWKHVTITNTMVLFYSLLRTEEDIKDMSKFEVCDK